MRLIHTMVRALALALAVLIALPARAGADCGDTHRFGQSLVRVGDSERRVLELRRPNREVRLETPYGGAAGYRLDFYEHASTVQVYVRSGVVTRICWLRK